MKGTQALRRKIGSAEQLQSVVRTMKVLAAANIRDCDRAVEALAQYGRAMELGLLSVVRRRPDLLRTRGPRARDRLGVVVFGSDEGMCGQLNDAVVDHAVEHLDRRSRAAEPAKIHVVGERAAVGLERAGRFPVDHVQSTPESLVSVAASVRETLLKLEGWRAEEDVNEIVLFYAKRESGAAFRPIRVRLLPIDREWIRKLHARAWPSRGEPVIGLDPRRMLRVLLRQHLYIALYRAFAESLASENASRLLSMEGAERNIDERLEELEHAYRRIRQTAITEELLDIMSGFEALEHEVDGA